MREPIAGIITVASAELTFGPEWRAAEYGSPGDLLFWKSKNPNVLLFSVKGSRFDGWGIKDQKIVFPDPIYEMSFESLWNYRKTPPAPKVKDASDRYSIVETDDGKWFSSGRERDLHLNLIGLFKLPPERIAKGLVYNSTTDVLWDEEDYSYAILLSKQYYSDFTRAHIFSIIWAIEEGNEPYIFRGWEKNYPSLKKKGEDWYYDGGVFVRGQHIFL